MARNCVFVFLFLLLFLLVFLFSTRFFCLLVSFFSVFRDFPPVFRVVSCLNFLRVCLEYSTDSPNIYHAY